jgi:hypothetical protein
MLPANTVRSSFIVISLLTSMARASTPLMGQAVFHGARIRVTLNSTPSTTFIATVDTQSGDTVHLQRVDVPGRIIPLNLAGPRPFILLSTVQSLEVSLSRRSYWQVGAGVGALVGLGVGVAVAKAEGSTSTLGSIGSDLNRKSLEVVGGMLGGALIGGLVGSAVVSEKWQRLPLSSLQPRPLSLSRVGFGISVRF